MSNVKKEEIECIWCIRNLTEICEHNERNSGVSETITVVDETPESDGLQTYKTDASLKDQQSTGRKRAAKLYPLNPDGYCEWAGKSKQGGGTNPIEGCGLRPSSTIGNQQCRHHGPDKNTLNNEQGNVHRICTPCHNEWHAKNDKDYVPGQVVAD